MLTNHTVYKYETPYKGPFLITHYFTNVTVNLQCGAVQIKYNTSRINPYKSDIKVDDYSQKTSLTRSAYELPVIYFCLKPMLGANCIIG